MADNYSEFDEHSSGHRPGAPYGYQDPDEAMRRWHLAREKDLWDRTGRPANIDPNMSVEEYADQLWNDPRGYAQEQTKRLLGWTDNQIDASRDAQTARESALALDADMQPQLDAARGQFLETRERQAALLGPMAQRASMEGRSASQWASQAGMNQLMNQVAAQGAQDPRMSMRGLAAGGGRLAAQAAQAQGAEAQARRGMLLGQVGAVRGGDLAQAGREQQALADNIAWQQAKEQTAQQWADAALRSRGVDLGVEGAIRAAQAGANSGGIGWQNVTSGILGGVGAGLGAYSSMNNSKPPQQPGAPPIPGYKPVTRSPDPATDGLIDPMS